MEIEIQFGQIQDIPKLIQLNEKWYKSNLNDLTNGYLSVIYSEKCLQRIIENFDLTVLKIKNEIVGYCLVNSVIDNERLKEIKNYYFNKLHNNNSNKSVVFGYQILFDTSIQNKGLFKSILTKILTIFKAKYSIIVSTVSKSNIKSINVHRNFGWKFYDTKNDYYIIEL